MSGTFRSLRLYNYRVWFFGALISNIGGWMQSTAQDWVVLTHLTDNDATACRPRPTRPSAAGSWPCTWPSSWARPRSARPSRAGSRRPSGRAAIQVGATAGLVAAIIGVIWLFTSGHLHREADHRFRVTLDQTRGVPIVEAAPEEFSDAVAATTPIRVQDQR